jgi:hypothetical protein
MNLKQFAELIVEMHSRSRDPEKVEVVLPAKGLWAAVGPSAAIEVTGVYNGSDWDAYRLFIQPEFPVAIVGEEYEKARANARDLSETIGWIRLTLSNTSMTDAQKITAIKGTLKRP